MVTCYGDTCTANEFWTGFYFRPLATPQFNPKLDNWQFELMLDGARVDSLQYTNLWAEGEPNLTVVNKSVSVFVKGWAY